MEETRITCRECGAAVRRPGPAAAGAGARCPRCGAAVRPGAEDTAPDAPARDMGAGVVLAVVAGVLLFGGGAAAVTLLWPSASEPRIMADGPGGAPPKLTPMAIGLGGSGLVQTMEVGNLAVEIDGEDIDGRHFRLSDYRGMVILLDFWGHWLSPSRAMYPHERAIVKRLEGKPFALVGVNSDADREAVKGVCAAEQITWPSFWDGGGPDGPIARQWKVRGWPTTFLIDPKGVIRFKNLRGPAIDVAVDQLLAEMGNG